MTHIHWVARQNKLEIPRDKDEVNNREIHTWSSEFSFPFIVTIIQFFKLFLPCGTNHFFSFCTTRYKKLK